MKRFSKLWVIMFSVMLTGCSGYLYCINPDTVSLVKQLPCANCQFRGFANPNLCPDDTYPYKLQCAAKHLGGNTVLVDKPNKREPGFRVYQCPTPRTLPANPHDKTDIANNCCNLITH